MSRTPIRRTKIVATLGPAWDTPEGMIAAKQSLTTVDTDDLLVPLDLSKVGASPSNQSYILQPDDVPGGAKALTEAYESDDVATLVS